LGERDHLHHHCVEPLVRPALCLGLLAQWRQTCQRCGGVSLGQLYTRLADREIVGQGQLSGRRQMALVQQRQHVCGSNVSHPMDEAMLAHGLADLREQGGRAGHISLGKLQAGKKHLTENESVKTATKLPGQAQALAPVPLSGSKVVPLVEDPGQTQMCFAGNGQRWITEEVQNLLVGLGCLIELVFCMLDVTQADGRQDSSEAIAGSLAERDGFGVGPKPG
jgi:hypothetical protein